MPDAIRCTRGVDVARTFDSEITSGIDGIKPSARGVDGSGSVDVDITRGEDSVLSRCHAERAALVALDIELGILVSAMRNVDAFDPFGSDDVGSRVIHVELACGLDLAAVIVVELQVVGAVPRPGTGLVARRGVVLVRRRP